MADDEIGLRCADYFGINRQVLSEDDKDQFYISTQNLYERKIGELQPRGGSVLYPGVSTPSNITSFGQPFVLYDRLLGKTKFMKVGCSVQTGTITNANVSAAFVNDVSNGYWGYHNGGTGLGIANAFIGCTSIQLVATGFGVYQPLNAALTAGLPVSGDTKKLVVTISGGGLANSNITGIDVYASVIYAYSGGSPQTRFVYVGHINLVLNPTGTFTFYNGPITLGADPGAGNSGAEKILGGPGSDAIFTVTGGTMGGGQLVPGKTYWVAMMSQYLAYNSGAWPVPRNTSYWAAYSVQAVTIQQGQNSIVVSKTGAGSPATLLAVGTHPHLLQPYNNIVSNLATFSIQIPVINSPNTNNANQMGCVNFIPGQPGVNTGSWIYSCADFAPDEMMAYIDPTTGKWSSIGINNFNLFNSNNDNSSIVPWSAPNTQLTVSSGADWVGHQYADQGQDLLFMLPKANWNALSQSSNGQVGGYFTYKGTVTSGSNLLSNLSSTVGIPTNGQIMPIYGAGIPVGTFVYYDNGSHPGASVGYKLVDAAGAAVNATATNSSTPLTFYQPTFTGTLTHNVVECDGNVATLQPISFGHAPPPQASLITTYKERLIISGGKSAAFNRCYFTAVQGPNQWGAPSDNTIGQYFQAESGGEEVTGISLYTNTMYYTGPLAQFMCAKLNTVFVFTDIPVYDGSSGSPSVNSATMIQLAKKTGCANQRTIVQTEMGTIFCGVDNVWLYRDSGEPIPIGSEIQYLLRPEDPTIAVDTSQWSAVYHDNKYKLSFSVNGSSVPSMEVWLDLRKMKALKGQPAWFGPHVGREVRWQVVEEKFNDTIIAKRFCVDGTNLRWYQADQDDQRQDFGADMTYLLQPHIMPFKNPNANKLLTKLHYEMKVDQAMTFQETMTMLNANQGENTETNNRTVNPITGYTGGTGYANFVSKCRTKIYLFYPTTRNRGENLTYSWQYTGHVLFTIKAVTYYTSEEKRRVD